VIYSGLDWSGSPGQEHGPTVVFAIVHVDEDGIRALDDELAAARVRLNVVSEYPFRHSSLRARGRRECFAAIARMPFTSHVYILEKTAWATGRVGSATGPDCLCDGIVALVERCPDKVVAGQILYIDASSDEEKGLVRYKTAIRQCLRAARPRRMGFKDVRPCPDHRLRGGIIQVADMIAGEVKQYGGIGGSYLPTFGARVQLV
jgi:hypothetical protein